jgi:hypothetical protein
MNNRRLLEESNPKYILDANIQRPKVVPSQKVDRNGSKTAPIETDFVRIP